MAQVYIVSIICAIIVTGFLLANWAIKKSEGFYFPSRQSNAIAWLLPIIFATKRNHPDTIEAENKSYAGKQGHF
ncbi:MAG TPA: hypothetical protein DD990_36495 [Cyanobacteria bacterium UBA11368]|nr:hypothetical protein [Cyanobacteria bacterium UBA11368]